MSDQETIRQHWVPRTHLNRFAVERKPGEYQIHVLDKDKRVKSYPASTDKLCVKKNMYTLPGDTPEERQIVEKIYGEHWESDYHKVCDFVTDDGLREIDDATRMLIIGTVTTLLFRTMKWKARHNELMEQVFQTSVAYAKQTGSKHVVLDGKPVLIDVKTVQELVREYDKEGHSAQVITQLSMAMKLAVLRAGDNVGIVKIDSEENFVTSDHPVGIWNEHGGIIAPFSPSNALQLPINAKYRIDIYPAMDHRVRNHVARITHDGLMATAEAATSNETQLQQCEYYLLGDRHTLDQFETVRNDQDLVDRIKAEQKRRTTALFEKAKAMGIPVPPLPKMDG